MFLVASLLRDSPNGRGCSGSIISDTLRSSCSWWFFVYLIFLPVPYSLIAEASVTDAFAFAVAFYSTSSAWSIGAPATSATSLAMRPKVAMMSACMTSCAFVACCSAAALCMAFSSAACCRSTSFFALCSSCFSSSSSVEGKTLCPIKCSVRRLV